ncbi:MAG: protein kinase [Deltaproteobacteria bacterium]|nr:protein kinase [Deltaproteobacteria bacterium]
MITHLATGGMAQIYLARHAGLGSFERHVVLKTIARERASDQRFVTMFLDEAKLAATLNHQNVAQVYEVDQADGAYFMAMEYVHGENARAILETALRRGWTIPLELAVMIIGGAAAGLHHAHERRGKNGQPLNIVHRDVSPANIMVGYDGSIKVLDFGIAKAEERATKTVGGTIKGKYGYMSPEQCKGKPIDRRSDIFALGIVLYELTTLRRAFKGNDDFETMKRIVGGDVVPPSAAVAGYPRELEAIILTALANDPASRFQTAAELNEALDGFTIRAKLTGSSTAMGRFMTQLFGTKPEPWAAVEKPVPPVQKPSEPTEVVVDEDNEKTAVVDGRHDVVRRLQTERDQPGDDLMYAPTEQVPTQRRPTGVRYAATVPREGRASVPPPVQATAEELHVTPHPNHTLAGVGAVRLSNPLAALATTPPPASGSEPPRPAQPLLPADELSDVGARPLVSFDARAVRKPVPAVPVSSSAPSAPPELPNEDYKIRSSHGWLIVAILLVLGVAAAVAAIVIAG